MSSMAKTAREAMKAKAKRLGGDRPTEKVDSSTWTPPELLNADVKTGLRPVSRRAFKKGGKVMGDCNAPRADRKPRKSGGKAITADSLINRNVKEANEDRAGIKHIGGMKKGGAAKRKGREEGGKVDEIAEFLKKDSTPFPKAEPRGPSDNTPDVTPAQAERMKTIGNMKPPERKSGGRTKKMMGGPMMGGSNPAGVSDKALNFQGNPVTPGLKRGGKAEKHDDVKADKALIKKMVKPEARTGKAKGGAKASDYKPSAMDSSDPRLSPAMAKAYKMIEDQFSPDRLRQMAMKQHDARMKDSSFAAQRAKRGMDVDVNPYEDKSKSLAQMKREDDDAQEKGYIASQKAKGGRTGRKTGGGVFTGPSYPGKIPGVVPGGRTARATGGKARGKGKTNINIVIAAGKTPGADAGLMPPGGMPKPPGGIPIPLPAQGGAPQGGAPMPMPMPMPPQGAGGPPGAPPMARKAGGRISKVASSYKDMEAGSAGGEGRLQKTDIAKKHKGAPTFKKGGKVYRSYKNMDAGAASGLGRLEKTEIAARKG